MNCSVRWRICSPIRNGPRAEPRGDLAAACSRATACTRALGGPKPRKLSDASLMITPPTLDLWLLEDVASCREHPGQNETALQILGPSARPHVEAVIEQVIGGRQVPAAGVPFLPRHPAMPF